MVIAKVLQNNHILLYVTNLIFKINYYKKYSDACKYSVEEVVLLITDTILHLYQCFLCLSISKIFDNTLKWKRTICIELLLIVFTNGGKLLIDLINCWDL